MVVFMIVVKNEPIFEADFGSAATDDDLSYLHQFILHSSLDVLQTNAIWLNNNLCYLKTIDRFNSVLISAYITPGGTTLLLLHNNKSDDIIRLFMIEVYEIYVKYLLNPFVIYDSPIVSPLFDIHIRRAAKKTLQV